jgi:hypothetical protein
MLVLCIRWMDNPMPQLTLTPAQQRRLERLALEAGRTPKATLRFVLRDGFDACEEDTRVSKAADGAFARGEGIPHKEAMKRVRSAIESHARGSKQPA